MLGRIDESGRRIVLPDLHLTEDKIRSINNVHIVACGTAYHAGLVGGSVIERLVRIPVMYDVASEYRYRSPLITPETLVIVVSQSGETRNNFV